MNRRQELTKRYHEKSIAVQIAVAALAGQTANVRQARRFMEMSYDMYVENAVWLRRIGRVNAESYGGRKCFHESTASDDHPGWFTNDHGESYKDGSGLCWGVVYQLPARRGRARFIAGYEFGGCDMGGTLDTTRLFEEPCRYDSHVLADTCEAAREAAYRADKLARDAAYEEREYQRKQEEEEREDEDAA